VCARRTAPGGFAEQEAIMRLAKRTSTALLVIAASAAAMFGGATAAMAQGAPIGPNQFFIGLVNGNHTNAVIYMVCPGPSFPGQTGHPESGQNVSVTQSSTTTGGFTGSLANSIVVSFAPSSTAGITLKNYDTPAAIPTSLVLPCAGTGKVTYDPEPTSQTAKSDVVTVTFINIAA
jgi:hypothetical protein